MFSFSGNTLSQQNEYIQAYARTRDFKTIQKVIQSGLDKMNADLSEDMFRIWLDYSRQMVNLTSTSAPSLPMSYFNFTNTLLQTQIPPYKKMSECVNFLITAMRYL